jgi:putative transposase
MAQGKRTINLTELLLECIGKPDLMLNMLERLNKEIRRRTRVVGIFPNQQSNVRLVTTYLMECAEDWSVSRAYLSEQSLQELLGKAA